MEPFTRTTFLLVASKASMWLLVFPRRNLLPAGSLRTRASVVFRCLQFRRSLLHTSHFSRLFVSRALFLRVFSSSRSRLAVDRHCTWVVSIHPSTLEASHGWT